MDELQFLVRLAAKRTISAPTIPPRIVAWIVLTSLMAMVLYWSFVAMNGSPTANDATGQIFDVKQGRHPTNHGAYVTWRQLETIVILGLPALLASCLWYLQQVWHDRHKRR